LHQTDPVTGLLLDGWRTKHLHLLRYKAGVNKRTLRLGLGWSFTGSLFTGWPAATIAMYSRISIFLTRKDLTKDQAAQKFIWQRTAAEISTLRPLLSQRLKPAEDDTLLERVCKACLMDNVSTGR